jgi:hypothetical protein
MSALHPRADIDGSHRDVRLWHKADIAGALELARKTAFLSKSLVKLARMVMIGP